VNFVNFAGQCHKNSDILIIFRARITYNSRILLFFQTYFSGKNVLSPTVDRAPTPMTESEVDFWVAWRQLHGFCWLCTEGMSPGQFDIEIYGEAPDKMTYTEQANKRTNCKRLTWYLTIISGHRGATAVLCGLSCGRWHCVIPCGMWRPVVQKWFSHEELIAPVTFVKL